jgi:transposase InsO family protein
VNHKRVARIMREDDLLGIQPRRFVATTDSDHALEVYLNLARRMHLSGIDQLWVADITYIRLRTEFVYLAVILDGFSRKVVGWKLDRTLAARLAVEALQQAIELRRPLPGLVHHSDRGIQYASADFVGILKQRGIIPSMSRPASRFAQSLLIAGAPGHTRGESGRAQVPQSFLFVTHMTTLVRSCPLYSSIITMTRSEGVSTFCSLIASFSGSPPCALTPNIPTSNDSGLLFRYWRRSGVFRSIHALGVTFGVELRTISQAETTMPSLHFLSGA